VKLFHRKPHVDSDRVAVEREGSRVVTRGLAQFEQQELAVPLLDESLADEAAAFLEYVLLYLDASERPIKAEETFQYGFWIVKFRAAGELLETWEHADDGVQVVQGADRALRFWRDQNRVCREHEAPFAPPGGDTMLAVSDGVWEGRDLTAARYVAPEHMSGWWLTTDLYDGNVESIHPEHAYHAVARRPEIVPYLALPAGFWFRTGGEVEVGFDRALLEDD
jgi:hypothetical protein